MTDYYEIRCPCCGEGTLTVELFVYPDGELTRPLSGCCADEATSRYETDEVFRAKVDRAVLGARLGV